ncbi:DUF2635 domain-containing protein [Vibrio cholerae]|uniref:DUF2635 domain-containing protein n=1 Tax=Vibrio cholerae TaxID=666 RepID=UPI00005F4637|nr:DUF2635 domain-containing protein [Vibrio cholerae]EMC8699306.1 DUF2635 domain-containing protein [Vibrio cholerae]EMP90090.1 hypothetical protein VC116063_003671 [Vibrio cholerae O1 str. 116063]KFD95260.1 hypothetical protein DN33_1657 [Vibrio cholerae]KNA56338.1 hypothetical protein VCV51_032911 [Vibrio cholerae V51]OFJ09803.1 hypothetical protein BFX28_17550 [Vibrio cholerae]
MEQNQIKVKPAKTSVPVRKENGEFLKQEGETVTRSAFWVRRLKDGDVLQVDEGMSQDDVEQVADDVIGLPPAKKTRAKAQETGE